MTTFKNKNLNSLFEHYNKYNKQKYFIISKTKKLSSISNIYDSKLLLIEQKFITDYLEFEALWEVLNADRATYMGKSNIALHPALSQPLPPIKVESSVISTYQPNRDSYPTPTSPQRQICDYFEYNPKEANDALTSNEINPNKRTDFLQSHGIYYSQDLESNCNPKNKRTKYKMFNSEFKNICVKLLDKGIFIDEVCRLMGVPKKSLKRWTEVGVVRKKGCGRKIKDPQMERALINWYLHRRTTGKCVSPKMMKKKALELTKFKGEFCASKGWLEKLKKKYNLILSKRDPIVRRK